LRHLLHDIAIVAIRLRYFFLDPDLTL
jgi:hypothetical protein